MSIKIHEDCCIGCGRCEQVCPGNLIQVEDDKKAVIAYPDQCWGCCGCVKACPVKAIGYYLGEDIGGEGALMYLIQEENTMTCEVRKNEQVIYQTVLRRQESNHY